jgi:methionyl-tRNA formyltransferase
VRLVVLTNRSPRGVVLLEALSRADIRIDAIIIDADRPSARDQANRARRMVASRGIGETSNRIRRKMRRVLTGHRGHGREIGFYRAFSEVVKEVPNANAAECERLLRSLVPDVIVLGGSRILKPHIVRVPRIGVLNPHPGLLPAYRGVDVIPWALHNEDPLGVTVHFVDPGIDTGDIVAQRPFSVQPGDTPSSLKRRADMILGQLMAEVVSELAESGRLERRPQERGVGRLYSLMPQDLKAGVKANLESMDAPQDSAQNHSGKTGLEQSPSSTRARRHHAHGR